MPPDILVSFKGAPNNNGWTKASITPFNTDDKKEPGRVSALRERNQHFKIQKNIPRPGFFISRNVQLGESDWYVYDPCGFKIKLSLSNFADIVSNTSINKGLIQDMCVWVRRHTTVSELYLLPVSHKHYQSALKSNSLLSKKLELTSSNIGDTIQIESGIIGTYLGKLNIHKTTALTKNNTVIRPHILLNRHVIEIIPGVQYFCTSSPGFVMQIAKAKTKGTIEGTVLKLNQNLLSGKVQLCEYEYQVKLSNVNTDPTVFVTKEKNVKLELVECTRQEIQNKYNNTTVVNPFFVGHLIVEDESQQKYVVSHYSDKRFKVTKIKSFDPTGIILESRLGGDLYLYNSAKQFGDYKTLDNFVKFYTIAKRVNNNIYRY